tara:strand:- start:63 stop:401 length:339 start_codon:yes stop_codon:yes gene_type:complete
MAQLSSKIRKYLDREVDFEKDVLLQDDLVDGVSNPYIKEWNVAEAQPTQEQLDALDATTLENNTAAIANRKWEYPSLGDVVDAIFKKEAGDSTEFDSLAIKRQATKNKYTKS